MRKLLLLGCVLAGVPVAAHADILTFDPTSMGQSIKDAAQALSEAQRIEQQAMNTVHQLTSVINPNAITSQLTSAVNPLPGMGNMASMVTGGGGIGSVTGLARQFMNANTVYKPTSTGTNDFVAGLLDRQSNSWSNTQAMPAQQVQDAQARYDAIAEIQDEIPNVTSQADLTALNDRLEAEKAKLAVLQVQMQSTQTMASTQVQQYQLQEMQRQRQSADALMESFGGNANGTSDTNGLVTLINTPNVPSFNATGN